MRRWSRFLVAAGMAVLAAGVVPSTFDATQPRSYAATSSSPPNYQGLWWNSPPESESGWGINLAHQGDKIFATWFTYDSAGKAYWLSMTAAKTADRTSVSGPRKPPWRCSPQPTRPARLPGKHSLQR